VLHCCFTFSMGRRFVQNVHYLTHVTSIGEPKRKCNLGPRCMSSNKPIVGRRFIVFIGNTRNFCVLFYFVPSTTACVDFVLASWKLLIERMISTIYSLSLAANQNKYDFLLQI